MAFFLFTVSEQNTTTMPSSLSDNIEGLFIKATKDLLSRIASFPAPLLLNLSMHWLAGEALQLVLYYGMVLFLKVFSFLKENIYLEMQNLWPFQNFLHHIQVFNITWLRGGMDISRLGYCHSYN